MLIVAMDNEDKMREKLKKLEISTGT